MNDTSTSIWATLGKMLAQIILGFFYSIYGGWVFATIWGWFAVTILHLAPVTIVMAIAIRLLLEVAKVNAQMLKRSMQMDKIAKMDGTQSAFFDWVGTPFLDTFVLIGGACWHFIFFPLMTVMGF